MDVESVANEIGGDVCLKVGEGQDEVWLEGEDLADVSLR
jgi:hypothetical protein